MSFQQQQQDENPQLIEHLSTGWTVAIVFFILIPLGIAIFAFLHFKKRKAGLMKLFGSKK